MSARTHVGMTSCPNVSTHVLYSNDYTCRYKTLACRTRCRTHSRLIKVRELGHVGVTRAKEVGRLRGPSDVHVPAMHMRLADATLEVER